MKSLQCTNYRSTLCGLFAGLATSLSFGLLSPCALAQSTQNTTVAVNSQASQVLAAAQRDFTLFAQHNMQSRFGSAPLGFPLDISDVQDLKDARVAYGFPVYTVDPKDLLAGRTDLQALAKPNGQWRVVISLNDRAIGLATLEQNNGQWETVSYGASVLAKDVDASMGVHANAAHSNVRFIRIYQAKSDFLEVVSTQDAHARFMPLYSARQALLQQRMAVTPDAGVSKDSLLEAADLALSLRAAVKANLDSFR